MRINRPGVSEIIIVPYIVKDLLPGQRNPLILNKIRQKLKFLITKLYLSAVYLHLMRGSVDTDPARVNCLSRIQCVRAPQDRRNPRHKNLRAERLRDIFVYSQFKTLQLVPLFRTRRQHNNRYSGRLTHLSAHLPSIHLRHHHIQNHKRYLFILIE